MVIPAHSFNLKSYLVPKSYPDSAFPNKQRMDVTKAPEYASFNKLQQYSARIASQLLLLATSFGYIDPNKIQAVCDFGAGGGGPTFALKQFLNLQPGRIQALEQSLEVAQEIIQHSVLPESDVKIGDGLAYLRSGQQKYNLITAFMLGPDISGHLISNFIAAARHSLNPDGKLLVCSEIGTMNVVKQVCQQQDLHFDWIEGVSADPPIPSTAIISFNQSGEQDQQVFSPFDKIQKEILPFTGDFKKPKIDPELYRKLFATKYLP